METLQNNSDASVKVQVAQLNTLMNLAGELVLGRNQLLQAISYEDQRLLESTSQRLDMVTTEIQEQIMRTRMQQISMIFENLPSIVKSLSQQEGKIVELSITGDDLELDKTIIEIIEKSLKWIIQKAVKHGIEAPVTREKHGKPTRGTIEIKAMQEAGQAVIEIIDDGKGILPDEIVQHAIKRELLSENQGTESLTDSEKLGFVFLHSLFHEHDETDTFRQYIGIEMIKSDLEKVGGSIDLDSRHYQGTHFRIKLPLTLSIIPSQIIRLGDERFAIPQVNLSELLRIPADQVKDTIETVGGASVIRLRGELLPIIDFAKLLEIERFFVHPENGRKLPERRHAIADRRSRDQNAIETVYEGPDRRTDKDRRFHAESALNVAVVTSGEHKYGLVVDAMNDSEEIVVKPLGKHLKNCRGFSGATIMGDGKVALILDVASIGEMCALRPGISQKTSKKIASICDGQNKVSENKNSYLFFNNTETERFAVPLDMVERIEKIEATGLETLSGTRVLKYRGGILPLLTLADAIMVDPLPEKKHYQVIYFNLNNKEFGLLCTPPIDVAEVTLTMDTKTLKQPGVIGSAVTMGQTTLFLDIEQILRNCKPDFFNEVCDHE